MILKKQASYVLGIQNKKLGNINHEFIYPHPLGPTNCCFFLFCHNETNTNNIQILYFRICFHYLGESVISRREYSKSPIHLT